MRELIRFVLVGSLTTGINFGTFSILEILLLKHTQSMAILILCNTISIITSMSIGFFLNKHFKKYSNLKKIII